MMLRALVDVMLTSRTSSLSCRLDSGVANMFPGCSPPLKCTAPEPLPEGYASGGPGEPWDASAGDPASSSERPSCKQRGDLLLARSSRAWHQAGHWLHSTFSDTGAKRIGATPTSSL
jgi:hypothetical protein